MIDPIVDEVRRFRREHAQSFSFALHAICADIRQFEASCGHDVVELPPKTLVAAVNRVHLVKQVSEPASYNLPVQKSRPRAPRALSSQGRRLLS